MSNDPISDVNHLVPYPHNPDQMTSNSSIRVRLQVMNDERPVLLGFMSMATLPGIDDIMVLKNQFDGIQTSWRVVLVEDQQLEREPNAHFANIVNIITVTPA